MKNLFLYDEQITGGDFFEWVEASKAYYNTDEPLMSDEEFDLLTEQLTDKYVADDSLEGKKIYQILTKGIQLNDGNFKTEHNTESLQLSLNKIKYKDLQTISKIKSFFKQGTYLPSTQLFISPKLDGINIKIQFDSTNKIKLIQTRGGQDVTDLLINHKDFQNLKVPETLIIHGELCLSKQIFKEKYSNQYANERNAINGVLKQDPNDLDFIPCIDGFQPYFEKQNNLPVLWNQLQPGLNLQNLYQSYYKNDDFKYRTDGIVIGFVLNKISDFKIKNNYPLNIIAVKFDAETVVSTIIDIVWSEKKSGKLTPVAIIEPTNLDGSIINQANLYSYNIIKSKHIGIGSKVEITKSGDIIPIVKRVITKSTNFNLPKDHIVNGKHLFSIVETLEQKKQKFILGLKVLQIQGIGETLSETIGKIVNYDIVKVFDKSFIPDIHSQLGDGSNWNKWKQIYNTNNLPLDTLIEMLQLNNCGKVLSRKFAQILTGKTIDTTGINKELLKSVCKNYGVYNTYIKNSMNILNSYGIKVIKPLEISDNMFSFEMSGDVPNGLTKQKFVEQLKLKNPNALHTTLTKETKYLFVDSLQSNSSKVNKARKYNVTIMTYDDALKYDFNSSNND